MHFAPQADVFGMDGVIVLVVVAVVLFGSTQIPKLARSLGTAQKEFKKGIEETSADETKGDDAQPHAAPTAAMNPAQPASPKESGGDRSGGTSS